MAELTSREREIFDLLCAGLSTVAIAARLQLSPKTIRNKLSTIFAKLRVANRTEAIAAGATLTDDQNRRHGRHLVTMAAAATPRR